MSASGSGDGSIFGSIPDSLPERMQPSLGNILGSIAAVFIAVVGGIVSAIGVGVAAVPLGFGRAMNDGIRAVASYLSDVAWAFFGPIANASWASAGWLDTLGPFGYLAAIVLVGVGMYGVAEVLPGDG